ncbi:hypothetical protein L0665_05850 [Methanogenium marinum]|uniref:Peptidase S54 rhomboid domain-containing protein n=1 Tax=Methanogenium marinum TaxID=348610 RepID=A0A9Q4KT16_9EURY|nr:hypothetical protein [Methanogenium marinum]MDE4908131.1 hypothetical protein [Methanogenium marinum]
MKQTAKKHIYPILHQKIKTIQTNLGLWKPASWLFYWGIVPLILTIVWSLPPDIKYGHFILDTTSPHWTSIILSSYTHSDISHISNNIGLYLLAMAMIFTCCKNPKLLHYSSLILFIFVPLFTSVVTMQLSVNLGIPLYSQGFSAVAYSFTALGLYTFFSLVMPGMPPLPFESGSSHPYPKRDILALSLILITIVLVLAHGLSAGGIVTNSGGFVNGPAHVIGFFSGIITVSLLDIRLNTNNVRIDYLFILFSTTMIIPYILMLE